MGKNTYTRCEHLQGVTWGGIESENKKNAANRVIAALKIDRLESGNQNLKAILSDDGVKLAGSQTEWRGWMRAQELELVE